MELEHETTNGQPHRGGLSILSCKEGQLPSTFFLLYTTSSHNLAPRLKSLVHFQKSLIMTQTNNNPEVTAETKANAEALVPRFKLTRVLNQGMPTEDNMLAQTFLY